MNDAPGPNASPNSGFNSRRGLDVLGRSGSEEEEHAFDLERGGDGHCDSQPLLRSPTDSIGPERNTSRSERKENHGRTNRSFTTKEEKAVVRKLDTRLVLFMCLLYMLSFLDRSNIGNARIAGLETTLPLRPGQYAWLLTAFYITYIAFEWMALLYRIVPAHIYISLCVFAWGLIASLQSVARSFASLAVLRALLGIAEAAFGPGVPFYLSFFYKRSELAYRVGLFISAAPLATSFASTLAWVIVKAFEHSRRVEAWRALFLIEGFPSLVVAVFAWFVIPDSPATTRYLTARQRKIARVRLREDERFKMKSSARVREEPGGSLRLKDVLNTLLDPKSYLTAFMFFSANVAFSSFPVFLPTILNSPSSSTSSTTLTPLQSQILSAPPYLISFPFLLYISHRSDRKPNSRAYHLILTSLLSAISYLILGLAGHFHIHLDQHSLPFLPRLSLTFAIRYLAVHGACMGFFTTVTLIITWTLNNQRTSTGRGTGIALLNYVGQCGPLLGTRLYPDSHAPFFVQDMLICAGFMAAVAVLAVGLRWRLSKLNEKADLRQAVATTIRGGGAAESPEEHIEMREMNHSDRESEDDRKRREREGGGDGEEREHAADIHDTEDARLIRSSHRASRSGSSSSSRSRSSGSSRRRNDFEDTEQAKRGGRSEARRKARQERRRRRSKESHITKRSQRRTKKEKETFRYML